MDSKSQIIEANHPYLVVEEIIGGYGKDLRFEFGQYIHYKDTIEDYREYIQLDAEETNKERIEELISSLKPDYELALHSRVHFGTGEILHIPMIDFNGRLSPEDWKRVIGILPPKITKNLIIFETGNSYHGYSTELLHKEDWIEFMGTVLLLNTPNSEPIIDSRWVGHRLLGGFGSLRWSCNTSQYKKTPNLFSNKKLIP